MLREYRPFYGTYIWMIPSGKADKEKDILVAAQRELQEETGITATEYRLFEKQTHQFSDRMVELWFFLVENWEGKPCQTLLLMIPVPIPRQRDSLLLLR